MVATKAKTRRKIICCVVFLCVLWELFSAIKASWSIERGSKTTTKKRTTTRSNAVKRREVYHRPRARKDRKLVYYLHIHKSGGSTICKQARKQLLSVKYIDNCNVQDDQRCCGGEDSLEAQIRYAKASRFDLVASEREMYDAMATDYYDYVVTLRDSATRYVSHWHHLRTMAKLNPFSKNGTRTNETLHSGGRLDERIMMKNAFHAKKLETGPGRSKSGLSRAPPTPPGIRKGARKPSLSSEQPKMEIKMNDTHEMFYILQNKKVHYVGNFSVWWEHQPDNYNTRMICGSKCLNSPKFQISPELFEYTLQRLSRFSHILFLEDLSASYQKFAGAIGWNRVVKVGHENQKMGQGNHQTKTIAERMVENLRHEPFMTVLDDALYTFARKRYENNYPNDTTLAIENATHSVGVQSYFRDGSGRNCQDPCCGNCSKWR